MYDKPRTLDRRQLASALQAARARTLAMIDDLSDAQLNVPQRPTLNPFLWEFGHVGWFQEYFCLRQGEGAHAQRPSMLDHADRWFDSSRVEHDSRWTLDLPARATVAQYVSEVLDRTLAALERVDDDDAGLYRFRLVLYHEDMHGEAFTYMRQALGMRAPRGLPAPSSAGGQSGDVYCAGGVHEVGMRPDAGFVFDNEKWAHPIELAPFSIAARCVSNEAFAAFVDAQGYERQEWWSENGRRWVSASGRTAPRDWRRENDRIYERHFDQWRPLDPAANVRHVNGFEAQAYCRWSGRRLPTEAEWEVAAVSGAIRAQGVWEWTASDFLPYDGFAADAYADYSAPWFGTHRVLRGASFATPERLVHPRFRNFFLPGRDDMFVGFRTCAI